MDDKLYQEALLEYYKYPKHRKQIQNPDFAAGDYNPSCGDRITMEGTIKDDILVDVGFGGSGCVISQATASMLTEDCIGKSLSHILNMTKDDIITMVGIPIGPTRLKCALLSLQVLQQGILDYKKKEHNDKSGTGQK